MSSSPTLPFPIFLFSSLHYLPTFHRFSTFPFPAFFFIIYPNFLLPSPSTSLCCPFRSSLYSSFLSTFPFPSQPSPSLLFRLPTYLFLYLSPSPPINFPLFPLPTFFPTLHVIRGYSSPFPLLFSSPFPFIFPLPFPPFLLPLLFHFIHT